VDAQEAVTALQLVCSVAILCYASVLDWRTRRVGNGLWMLLSVLAMVFLVARVAVDEAPPEYLLVLVPVLAVLADVYGPSGGSGLWTKALLVAAYAVAIATTIYLGYLWVDDTYFAHLLTAPVMMMAVVVMYMLDIVRGGADAKALMALSIMFPFYPDVGPLPLMGADDAYAEVLFPFSFVVLVTAAVIVAFAPIAFAVRNLAAGEFEMPYALLGYRLDADDAKARKVWLMERMEGGAHTRFTRPRREEDLEAEVDRLVSAGHRRLWVTPKIPFIVPITIGLAFTAVVGSFLVALMGL
jgi:preflagellin peptidase FlaK